MTPIAQRRLLLRAALALQQQYHWLHQARRSPLHLPEERWEQLQRLSARITKGKSHNYQMAARHSERQLVQEIRYLTPILAGLAEQLTRNLNHRPPPTLAVLYEELCSLFEEFDEVEIDLSHKVIAVRTAPITLEEIHLGSFEIRLEISELKTVSEAGSGLSYRVIALEPNPAAHSDETVHPHLQNERLCEGDGKQAIVQALSDGRFTDFFLLVSNILQTYNSASPYVALEDWHGVPCSNCGHCVNQDDCYVCECCDSTLCDSCSRNCPVCCVLLCYGCEERCADCENSFCVDCLNCCDTCQRMFCSDCLEQENCLSCSEPESEPEMEKIDAESKNTPQFKTPDTPSPSQTTPEIPSAHAAVQPPGLGQTALPA